jgi:hypothetical protein
LPKELNPGYCYFLPRIEGIEIISSLQILEIDHLLFHGYNIDKIITLSPDKAKEENHPSSPVTSLDSTPQSSWMNNTSLNEFSTPNGMNTTTLSSIASTPRKLAGHKMSFEPIDPPSSSSASSRGATPPVNHAIPQQSPIPAPSTTFPLINQEIAPRVSVDPPLSSAKGLVVRQTPESAVASPPVTSPHLRRAEREKSNLVPVQKKSIQDPSSPSIRSTPRKRGRPPSRGRAPDSPLLAEFDGTLEPLQFIQDKLSEYEEVSWERGVLSGLRTQIPREDVFLLEEKFESLGWKICSCLERSDWWSKEKCYLPPWSPLIQEPEGEFIVGIDIFWCLDDCLKYLKIFKNSEPTSRKKGRGVQSLRINLLDVSPAEFLHLLLDESDPDAQFSFVWTSLKSSGWRIQEVDSSLLSIPVNKVALPYWTTLSSSNLLTLDSFKKLKLNQDYFLFVQDAISYLQVQDTVLSDYAFSAHSSFFRSLEINRL